MNQLSNINATQIKEVQYSAGLQNGVATINFTVENCSVNAYINQVVIYLANSDPTFYNQVNLSISDRGHNYAGSINGYNPMTFVTIGTSSNASPTYSTPAQTVTQNGNNVVFDVFQSFQDSEGLGNIYVQLTRTGGTFGTSFTMAVIFRPEINYNSKFNTRNQISSDRPFRVLSQAGLGTYGAPTSTMTDQTTQVFRSGIPRNNLDILTNGFSVNNANPYFYFGTPYPTKRWFLGFSSDNTPNIGIITFSYFNGSQFVGFANTQVANGAQGPGTYKFANDGVVIFTPPASWSPIQMANDPLTLYNNTIIGLGTLGTNNCVANPGMFWIQCQVGFIGVGTLTISSLTPLIDPALPLTGRRRLI
jgi:hypothetical protein